MLPNKITLLEQLDGPDGNLVREWIEDTTEDCGYNGGAAAVEFTITPDLVQCPYDNGFRQYVRVWDQLNVGDKVRACLPDKGLTGTWTVGSLLLA